MQSGDLPLHEQSNPCLHGIIMDLKTTMKMMNGKLETDPIAISNIFNKKIVSMGPKINEKLVQGKLH